MKWSRYWETCSHFREREGSRFAWKMLSAHPKKRVRCLWMTWSQSWEEHNWTTLGTQCQTWVPGRHTVWAFLILFRAGWACEALVNWGWNWATPPGKWIPFRPVGVTYSFLSVPQWDAHWEGDLKDSSLDCLDSGTPEDACMIHVGWVCGLLQYFLFFPLRWPWEVRNTGTMALALCEDDNV